MCFPNGIWDNFLSGFINMVSLTSSPSWPPWHFCQVWNVLSSFACLATIFYSSTQSSHITFLEKPSLHWSLLFPHFPIQNWFFLSCDFLYLEYTYFYYCPDILFFNSYKFIFQSSRLNVSSLKVGIMSYSILCLQINIMPDRVNPQ